MLVSVLSPVVGQDMYDVGQSIVNLGDVDRSWEQVCDVEKALRFEADG